MFAILVIDNEGEENYVCDGMGNIPTRYSSRARAKEQVEFFKMGMEDEVQSINVVPYPKRGES